MNVPAQAVVDTSVFIAGEAGRSLDESRIGDKLAVSIITIGELRQGVLAAITQDADFDAVDGLDGLEVIKV